MYKGVMALRGNTIPLVDKDDKFLVNIDKALQPPTSPLGMEAQVCCRLIPEPSRRAERVVNCIRGDMGVQQLQPPHASHHMPARERQTDACPMH